MEQRQETHHEDGEFEQVEVQDLDEETKKDCLSRC
jgi:hypothetical protein